MKDQAERQRGFDGNLGVLQLPSALADAHGLPRGDRFRRQPQGDVASLDQCSVVRRPVADAVFRFVPGMHSRLHVEIMPLRPSRWPGPRRTLVSAHQRLCEGSTQDDDDPALDESCYNRIFAREFPRTRFVSVGAATTVEKRMRDLLPVLKRIVGTSIVRFRDRDALTPEEIEVKRAEGVCVMAEYRNIESMLLSNGVLSKLCDSLGRPECFTTVKTARDNALEVPNWTCHALAKPSKPSCATCSHLW